MTRRMSSAIRCQSSTSEPVSEDEARDECPPDEAVLQRAELEEYNQDYEEDQRGPYQLSSPFLRPGTGRQPKAPLAGANGAQNAAGAASSSAAGDGALLPPSAVPTARPRWERRRREGDISDEKLPTGARATQESHALNRAQNSAPTWSHETSKVPLESSKREEK